MARRILITGCSSSGKSILLNKLAERGHAVVPEAGLRAIRLQGLKHWEDLPAFIDFVTGVCLQDLDQDFGADRTVFYDRGLFDALSGKAALLKTSVSELLPNTFPYSEPVFFAPTWPDIFENTADRRLALEVAEEEAIRLRRDLDLLNIQVVELPRVSAELRTDFVLSELGLR